jgi:ActR/RegA family two-component response regulator
MKTILAVDLEDGVVSALATGLRERQSDVRLHKVSLARAADAVRREAFDLVVYHRGDHPASPAALVAALREASPATRLLVLGGADAQDRTLFASLGNAEVLARPVDAEDLAARIAAALQRGVKGHLENVGLAAFVQLLALEKETCALSVRSGATTGTLCFVGGELYDAEIEDRCGEDAAIEMLGWEFTDVEMTGPCLRSQRLIQRPLTFLLMEAMRRRDESGHAQLGESSEGGAAGRRVAAPAAPGGGTIASLARELDGFVAAALVDLASGEVLDTMTVRPDLDPSLAAAFCCELLRQEMSLLRALAVGSTLDDVLMTFSDEIHFIKLSPGNRFLYIVVDPARTSFPALRSALQQRWQAIDGPPRQAPERPASDRSGAERSRRQG